jgi:hypothetical protein
MKLDMKIVMLFFLGTLLSACATSRQIIGPSGAPAHAIRCGAAALSACYEKAGEICPSGYNILTSDGARYLGQLGNASVSGGYGSATSVPMITPNSLLVECKAAR